MSNERGRGGERREVGTGRGEKGGRGRKERDIVSSSSIFSMGPAEKLTPKRGKLKLLCFQKFSLFFFAEIATETFGNLARPQNPRSRM